MGVAVIGVPGSGRRDSTLRATSHSHGARQTRSFWQLPSLVEIWQSPLKSAEHHREQVFVAWSVTSQIGYRLAESGLPTINFSSKRKWVLLCLAEK
jgi:hypothetical protein